MHDANRLSNLIVLSEFAAAFCSAKSTNIAVTLAVAATKPFCPFLFVVVMLDAPYKSPVCLIVKDVPVVEVLNDVALFVISPEVAIEVAFSCPACEIDALVVTPFLNL